MAVPDSSAWWLGSNKPQATANDWGNWWGQPFMWPAAQGASVAGYGGATGQQSGGADPEALNALMALYGQREGATPNVQGAVGPDMTQLPGVDVAKALGLFGGSVLGMVTGMPGLGVGLSKGLGSAAWGAGYGMSMPSSIDDPGVQMTNDLMSAPSGHFGGGASIGEIADAAQTNGPQGSPNTAEVEAADVNGPGADPGDGYAEGGWVTRNRLIGPDPAGPDEGYGGLKSDEFVVNADAAKRYGPLLEALNAGRISGADAARLLGLSPTMLTDPAYPGPSMTGVQATQRLGLPDSVIKLLGVAPASSWTRGVNRLLAPKQAE